jgi:hypothetical protein
VAARYPDVVGRMKATFRAMEAEAAVTLARPQSSSNQHNLPGGLTSPQR